MAPTPVFLPGESHRQRSLAGYSPWGHKEPDTTERLTHTPDLQFDVQSAKHLPLHFLTDPQPWETGQLPSSSAWQGPG